jgi:hypothetical protein
MNWMEQIRAQKVPTVSVLDYIFEVVRDGKWRSREVRVKGTVRTGKELCFENWNWSEDT